MDLRLEFRPKRMPLRTLGLVCRHPVHPDRAVALLGTVRQDEAAPQAEGELEPFFASLAFTDERPVAFAATDITHRVGDVFGVVSVSLDAVWAATPWAVIALDRRNAAMRQVVAMYAPYSLVDAVFGAPTEGSPLIDDIAAAWMGDSLWVTHLAGIGVGSKVFRVDSRRGWRVTRTRFWKAGPIAATADSVFVATGDGLYRIGADDGEPQLVREGAHSAAVLAGDIIWTMERKRAVLIALDPTTGAERGPTIPLPAVPSFLVPSGDALLAVFDEPRPEVLRILLPSGDVAAAFPLPSASLGGCVRGEELWVSLPEEGVLRGFDGWSGIRVGEIPIRTRSVPRCDGEAIWTTVEIDGAIEVVRVVP